MPRKEKESKLRTPRTPRTPRSSGGGRTPRSARTPRSDSGGGSRTPRTPRSTGGRTPREGSSSGGGADSALKERAEKARERAAARRQRRRASRGGEEAGEEEEEAVKKEAVVEAPSVLELSIVEETVVSEEEEEEDGSDDSSSTASSDDDGVEEVEVVEVTEVEEPMAMPSTPLYRLQRTKTPDPEQFAYMSLYSSERSAAERAEVLTQRGFVPVARQIMKWPTPHHSELVDLIQQLHHKYGAVADVSGAVGEGSDGDGSDEDGDTAARAACDMTARFYAVVERFVSHNAISPRSQFRAAVFHAHKAYRHDLMEQYHVAMERKRDEAVLRKHVAELEEQLKYWHTHTMPLLTQLEKAETIELEKSQELRKMLELEKKKHSALVPLQRKEMAKFGVMEEMELVVDALDHLTEYVVLLRERSAKNQEETETVRSAFEECKTYYASVKQRHKEMRDREKVAKKDKKKKKDKGASGGSGSSSAAPDCWPAPVAWRFEQIGMLAGKERHLERAVEAGEEFLRNLKFEAQKLVKELDHMMQMGEALFDYKTFLGNKLRALESERARLIKKFQAAWREHRALLDAIYEEIRRKEEEERRRRELERMSAYKLKDMKVLSTLRTVYRQYALRGGAFAKMSTMSGFMMGSSHFHSMCKDCKLIDKKLTRQKVDMVFLAANMADDGDDDDDDDNPDRGLTFDEFLDCCLRVCKIKFSKLPPEKQLVKLMENHIKHARVEFPEVGRKKMQATAVANTLKRHKKGLMKLFAVWAADDKSSVAALAADDTMNAKEFLGLVKAAKLIDSQLSVQKALQIFVLSDRDEEDMSQMSKLLEKKPEAEPVVEKKSKSGGGGGKTPRTPRGGKKEKKEKKDKDKKKKEKKEKKKKKEEPEDDDDDNAELELVYTEFEECVFRLALTKIKKPAKATDAEKLELFITTQLLKKKK